MYSNILIGVDGSESNKFAVDEAVNFTKAVGGKLTAICVFDIGSYGAVAQGYGCGAEREFMMETSKAAMAYVDKKAAETGIPLECKVIIGRPAETLIEESGKYDLLVCGTLGRTGLAHAVIGSVAERVVRLAKCPVLVCRSTKKK